MGFAILHLSHFKGEHVYEDWLPVRGSNKMKNKQKFRDEILNENHENTNQSAKKPKGDGITRTGTGFDYITGDSEQKFGILSRILYWSLFRCRLSCFRCVMATA